MPLLKRLHTIDNPLTLAEEEDDSQIQQQSQGGKKLTLPFRGFRKSTNTNGNASGNVDASHHSFTSITSVASTGSNIHKGGRRLGGTSSSTKADSDSYPIQSSAITTKHQPAVKSCMKVSTLEESLKSCVRPHQKRASLLDALSGGGSSSWKSSMKSSMRSLLTRTMSSKRNGLSCETGMDLMTAEEDGDLILTNPLDPTITVTGMNDEDAEDKLRDSQQTNTTTTTTEEMEDVSSLLLEEAAGVENKTAAPQVRFTTIELRVYPVAPDDNPSVSKGTAIALSGWKFKSPPSLNLEAYEATRPPRRAMEDLKLDMVERRRRLLEHGASHKEMIAFAKRARKAKAKRNETVQAMTMYGKQHEAREERREKRLRFLQRAFRLRKTHSKAQLALWENANSKEALQKHQAYLDSSKNSILSAPPALLDDERISM